MKALQLTHPRSFVPVDVAMPELGSAPEGRLVVKTGSVSICGSDIPSFTGSRQPQGFPLPPGAPIHECAGTVVETTSSLLSPGDSWSPSPTTTRDSPSTSPRWRHGR